MQETRIVRLIALDRRYRMEPYKDFPAYSETLGTYITGQHIVPGDPSTRGNLTVDEMSGLKMLSDEKSKRFPYVINPLNHVILTHLMKMDLSQEDGVFVDPRSKALYDYLQLQSYCGKHSKDRNAKVFYIEDEEAEARAKTSKRDMVYNAMKLLRESGHDEILNVALLLNHKKAGFYIDPRTTKYDIVMDKIMDVAETDPDIIIDCYTDAAKELIFIAKLHLRGVITRKGSSYFDGNEYLGEGLEGVVRYIRTPGDSQKQRASRWSSVLAKAEQGIVVTNGYDPEKEKMVIENEVRDAIASKYKAYEAYMESVLKQTRIDILAKQADGYGYPVNEYEGIDTLSAMKQYMLDKYKSINNMS